MHEALRAIYSTDSLNTAQAKATHAAVLDAIKAEADVRRMQAELRLTELRAGLADLLRDAKSDPQPAPQASRG